MKSIRKGNDIIIEWSIFRNGQPEPLEGKDIVLIMSDGYSNMQVKDYAVKDNVLTFTFYGKDQVNTGVYGLTLVINKGNEEMFTTDVCEAFRIVSSSCMVGGDNACGNLNVHSVELTGELNVPRNGLSAYEIAVENGFVGTVQEWLASLKGEKGDAFTYSDFTPEQIEDLKRPATDAAQTANQAAQNAITAGNNANTAAQNANQAVEDMAAEFAKKQDKLESGESIKTINGESVLGSGNIVINPTIMDLKWTTDVATTRKLVPVELRSKGIKIAYRDKNSAYHVEQYQADAVDDANWENDSNWKGCRTPMTPMFEVAGAKFNDETGYYELNGIIDISEAEMLYTYYATYRTPFLGGTTSTVSYMGDMYLPVKIRTNLKVLRHNSYGVGYYRCWFSSIQILNICPLQVDKKEEEYENIWYGEINFYAVSVERIIGIISFSGSQYGFVERVYNQLRYLKLKGINKTLGGFAGCPMIDITSLQYAVDNATNTSSITLKVHPTVYAKLTDPTNTEWYAVNEAAIAKQISFATTETSAVMALSEDPTNTGRYSINEAATTETQQVMVLSEDPTIQIVDGEMLVPAGYYLTQAAELPIEERLFITRKVMLLNEDMDNWRVATEEERQEQEDYFNSQLPQIENYEENQ